MFLALILLISTNFNSIASFYFCDIQPIGSRYCRKLVMREAENHFKFTEKLLKVIR